MFGLFEGEDVYTYGLSNSPIIASAATSTRKASMLGFYFRGYDVVTSSLAVRGAYSRLQSASRYVEGTSSATDLTVWIPENYYAPQMFNLFKRNAAFPPPVNRALRYPSPLSASQLTAIFYHNNYYDDFNGSVSILYYHYAILSTVNASLSSLANPYPLTYTWDGVSNRWFNNVPCSWYFTRDFSPIAGTSLCVLNVGGSKYEVRVPDYNAHGAAGRVLHALLARIPLFDAEGSIAAYTAIPYVFVDIPKSTPDFTATAAVPIIEERTIENELAPTLPIRSNYTAVPATAITQVLAKRLGIPLTEISDAVQSSPDIDKLISACVHFGLSLESVNFSNLPVFAAFCKLLYDVSFDTRGSDNENQLTLRNGDYWQVFNWRAITRSQGLSNSSSPAYSITETIEEIPRMKYDPEYGWYTSYIPYKVHSISFPAHGSTPAYTYTFVGLTCTYKLSSDTSYSQTYSITDNEFTFPVLISAMRTMSIDAQDITYQQSARLLVTSLSVQHLKWYQTGVFEFLLQCAAVVLTVLSPQFSAFYVALAAGSYVAAGMLALEYLVSVKLAEVAVDKLGGDGAIIAQLIAAYASGNFKLDFSSVFKALTTSANALSTATSNELSEFTRQSQAINQQYTDAFKSVESVNSRYSPIRATLHSETPSDYYERMVGGVSPYTTLYRSISDYYNVMLSN